MAIIVVILALLLVVACVKLKEANKQQQQVIQINQERQELSRQIESDIKAKKEILRNVSASIDSQNNILKSLKSTEQELREGAQERANQEYKARFEELSANYAQKEKQLENMLSNIKSKVTNAQNELDDIKAKQFAYIQAQQREEAIKAKKDYYRLVITDNDKADITLLRDIQIKLGHRDAIDKLIWEVYYKPAYDKLMPRLIQTNEKICGIYKITNITTNQSYIGQSVDIKERFRQHIKSGLSSQTATNKLYQSMKTYGAYDFTFEILEQVPRTKLNERETYWIDFYKTKDLGLNKTVGGA